MSDVNDNASAVDTAPVVEAETTQVESQQPEKTAEPLQPEAPAPQERTIPYSRFAEVNKGYKETQRRLADLESKLKLGQYSEDDMAALMAHPFVQELLIKDAKRELTDYASELLDAHPEIPDAVKKAIKTNVRGFVKESTTDVESGKIDIQEYIEGLADTLAPAHPTPKVFPVASTKPPEAPSNARPADVQEILEKPVDEWSEDEAKLVDQYKKTQPRK